MILIKLIVHVWKVAKTFVLLSLLVLSLTFNAGQFLGSAWAITATAAMSSITGIKAASVISKNTAILAKDKALVASQIALTKSEQALKASKAALAKSTAKVAVLTASTAAIKKSLSTIATKIGIRTAGRGVKVATAGGATAASGWIPYGGLIVATGFIAWEAHDICSSLSELKELEELAGLETTVESDSYALCGYSLDDYYGDAE